MGNGYVYSSAHISDDEATARLLANLEGEPLAEPRRLSFTTGRRRQTWNRNVVAMGLSSGFVEPLESTSIHMVQSGIARLISLFPDRRFDPLERDEYNRQVNDMFDDVRDFIILHYNATRRDDSQFWRDCRAMDLPETLARKLSLWRGKGRVFREGFELFSTVSWVAVMLGQGVFPEQHEPAADALDEDRVAAALDQMRQGYRDMAEQLPTHQEFIARTCAARPDPLADLPELVL
jgi:tryptophan halogenase